MARKRKTRNAESEDGDDENRSGSVLEGADEEDPAANNRSSEEGQHGFVIPYNGKEIICELRGGSPEDQPALVFTHGAGGGIDNPATQGFARGFAELSPIVCFQRKGNIQSRTNAYATVIGHHQKAAALGGRSMGARAAVIAANEDTNVRALVLVSYPLIGGKNGDVRDQVLLDIREGVDVLFMTATRDTMCPAGDLAAVRAKMSANSWLVEVEGADHGMSVKDKEGAEPLRMRTGAIAAEWLQNRDGMRQYCSIEWDLESKSVLSGGWIQKEDSKIDTPSPPTSEPPKSKRRKKA